jgi:hypothetical protein
MIIAITQSAPFIGVLAIKGRDRSIATSLPTGKGPTNPVSDAVRMPITTRPRRARNVKMGTIPIGSMTTE